MKCLSWFLLLLAVASGCSRPPTGPPDLQPDLTVTPDMAPTPDLPTPDLAVPPTLEILAGQPGSNGDAEGTGANARLSSPCGITVDASSNLYVTSSTHTLFRITTPGAVATRIAGMPGISGTSDGRGLAALFSAPCGLTIAPNTNFLYVADTGNHRIRRVDVTNLVVTTVTGSVAGNANGPLATATFNAPNGLIAADANTLYVSDTGNNALRRVDLAAGQVTTIAGFNAPRGLTLSGNTLYVADTMNHVVRSVDLTTQQVTTLAGAVGQPGSIDGIGTTARFNQPSGLALIGNSLYITDTANHTIRVLDLGTLQVTTYAGLAGQAGSSDGLRATARFNMPYGIVRSGNTLFITDAGNHTVRTINTISGGNAISTVAGAVPAVGCQDGIGPQARLYTPREGLVVDGNTLYFSDTNNQVLRSLDLGTRAVITRAGACSQAGFTDSAGSAARFNTPLALARVGRTLYVADANNHRIRQVNLDTFQVTTLAGTGQNGWLDGPCTTAQFNRPRDLTYSNNRLYISDTLSSAIREIDLATCTVTTLAGTAGVPGSDDGPCASALFRNPRGLTVHANGTLYVVDSNNLTVRAITPPFSRSTCRVSTVAGLAGISDHVDGIGSAARFVSPQAIADDGRGGLYVTDICTLRRIEIPTYLVTTVLGSPDQCTLIPGPLNQARCHGLSAIARAPDGALYLGDAIENVILAARGL